MINPLVFECGALLGGSALLGKLAVRRPATVEELVEHVDFALARKICSLSRDEFAEAVWIKFCTAGSMWHMISQARLLAKIVIEIRKENPGLMLEEPAVPVRQLAKAVRRAGVLSLFENVPVRGRKFCEMFSTLFQIVEESIISV